MKILTIRLKNLASIEGTFEIDFQAEPLRSAGIFAISGPTGAGKSTILDALCLALYDKTPRFSASVESLYMSDIGESRVNQADVKNILRRGTGEGFAEVDFLGVSGHCYRSRWSVRRTGSRANGALRSQTIQVTDLTANQELQGTRKELLAQLVTLVGLTYEQFTRTVLLAQNDFATFLKSRESAKAELLEKLTGTEIYSRISSEIYLRSKTADAELNQLKSNATLIELLSEEEITLLRTEKESLTNLREQGSKALIDLNAQLSVLHTLKLQQEQRDKKVQDMRLDEEKSKKLREEYTRQSDSLIRFRGQCEAVQPDLSRARELDVQIQSLVSQSKQVEEILQGAEKAVNAQANKLQSVQGALHTSCHSLKNLTGEIELPVTEETGLFLESVRNRLKEQEDQLAILQEKNEARVNRLNAFGIEAVTDEQARWMQEQTRLQNARQQMLEWRKAGTEAERLKAQQEEMGHKQEQMRKEITLLTTRLSEKEAELKVLQRLFENARIAMGKDVRTLRQNLRENEPCPHIPDNADASAKSAEAAAASASAAADSEKSAKSSADAASASKAEAANSASAAATSKTAAATSESNAKTSSDAAAKSASAAASSANSAAGSATTAADSKTAAATSEANAKASADEAAASMKAAAASALEAAGYAGLVNIGWAVDKSDGHLSMIYTTDTD